MGWEISIPSQGLSLVVTTAATDQEFDLSRQDPATGAWEPATMVAGRLDNGARPEWTSTASTAGIVLEAICRYRLLASRANERVQ
jgi:hypothetical protein